MMKESLAILSCALMLPSFFKKKGLAHIVNLEMTKFGNSAKFLVRVNGNQWIWNKHQDIGTLVTR